MQMVNGRELPGLVVGGMIVMARCRCGASLVPDLHFCVACGARQEPVVRRVPAMAGAGYPPPTHRPAPVPPAVFGPPVHPRPATVGPPRSNAPWIVAGVSAVVAVVLLALGLLLALRPTATTTVAVPTPVAAPTVTVGVPVAREASEGSEGSEGSDATGTDPSSGTAGASLQGLVEADRSTVEGVVGTWVPQLSAKHEGTKADGITYDDASILDHYSALAARYPSAALLWSGDWPVFNGSDYWVVVYPQSFPTAAGANAWCDAQGFAADDCLAKKLSHSGGPAGTTVPR
ncbi:hypothetical protein [Actinomycetospora sp. NBRC 106378]|uniref:hypothetical protein n=1 Tax=Actinomycetospora sp. NBRC 106378 TaxID=3032208 RepID=UPI0024A3B09A|nr:hypothetical protein [Actinomycetospora sp. NBRC 106378]GLZ52987.1 hypothetical protein Acsp07_26040 [Actinomycetospora sp. NBRC 106378]